MPRVTPAPRAQPAKRPSIPLEWAFVEKQVPGCFAEWAAHVSISWDDMILGVTGRPLKVVATDRRCYKPGYGGCRCHKFVNGVWSRRSHDLVQCCARYTFGDRVHDLDCPDRERRTEVLR